MPQNHEIRVKLKKEELEIIKKKSESVGLTASAFLRMLGLKADVEIK